MIRKNCKECGKFFYTYKSRIKDGRGKYCSKKCGDKNKDGREKGVMVEKVCLNCDKNFKVYPCNSDAKYCSKECHYNSKREKRQCQNCKDTFAVIQSSDRKYCSKDCFHKHLQKKNRVECECNYCGSRFKIIKSHLKRDRGKYCSRECHLKDQRNGREFACKNCGNTFYRSKSRIERGITKYCSSKCHGEAYDSKYPKTIELRNQISYEKARARRFVCNKSGIERNNVPEVLIKFIRTKRKLKRKLKEVKQ